MKKVRQKIRNKSGVSLVEMIFCVLLFTLAFMAGTAGLLYAFRSTDQLQHAADEQKVSDTILNRVEGELAGMIAEGNVYVPKDQSSPYTILGFTSASGIPVYMTTVEENGEKVLLIHYRETHGSTDGAGKPIAASDWTFDAGVYRDYTIQTLTFSTGEHQGRLTVTAELVLKCRKNNNTYETKRTVCCYNRDNATVVNQYSAQEIRNLE